MVKVNMLAPEKPPKEQIEDWKSRLRRILTQNIMPFWYPRTIDLENGGYCLNHDVNGKPLGRGAKMIVTQSRMLWYFSKLYNSGWAGKEALEAAEHGFKFLCDKMWDSEHGGFFWEVDFQGNVQKDFKNIYGQAFALYGLSEYIIASKSKEALNLARELFELIEKNAYDKKYGGYREFFTRNWSIPEKDGTTYIAPSMKIKTMNTHLHLLESFTTYYEIAKNSIVKQRLIELILILSNSVVRMDIGVCTDLHSREWKPLELRENNHVSYGHNLETLWLMAEACRVVGIPIFLLINYFQTIYNYCIKYGFDYEKGGIYNSGPINKPADRLEKIWWVQAESLVTIAYMYSLTRDNMFLEHFSKMLDWIENYQVDWKNGDWFNTILPDGKPFGKKADIWKSAYHNGRAMIETIKILSSLS
jgi:mannobiose 2-epimerase